MRSELVEGKGQRRNKQKLKWKEKYQSSVKQSIKQILDVKRVVKISQFSARQISKKMRKDRNK